MIEHFTTQRICPERRRNYWNELLEGTYSGMVVDAVDAGFAAAMARWQLGSATMIWPRSLAAVVARKRGSSVGDRLVMHLQHSGRASVQHRGRCEQLEAGDMVVCAASEDYRFEASRHQMLVVELDRALIEPGVPGLDDRIGTRISGSRTATRMLHQFLLSLWREGADGMNPALEATYLPIVAELLRASLQPVQDMGMQDVLVRRMSRLVKQRLADPGLSTSSLAAELGVSVRRLQLAVAKAGTTPVQYLTRQRLEFASERLLREPGTAVTDISLDAGFSDPAYFARRFQAHYGMSPSRYRARH